MSLPFLILKVLYHIFLVYFLIQKFLCVRQSIFIFIDWMTSPFLII
jgi:hypothetical protein